MSGRRRLVLVALCGAFLILGLPCIALWRFRRMTSTDQCVARGKRFDIRITTYAETGMLAPVPGAVFAYERQVHPRGEWREIIRFRHDDQIPAPCNQIRFLNDEIAYFFIGWIYAVTLDGGETWAVWNAETDLPGWRPANYEFIQSVDLSVGGDGIMHLNPIRFDADKLVTQNFGRDWEKPR